jgi:LmbE family N-acetylglucosaminyl deacetylase
MTPIQDAVVVVAHPDDEILWFSSILEQCKRVLVCFGPSATSTESWDDGRAALMDTYPLTKVKFLKLRESDAFGAANWNRPKEADSGLQLRRRRRSRYQENAGELRRILEVELNQESVVFTHNPWGEYGHEEHVQVCRILWDLKERIGFELFVTSYVSDKSVKLMSKNMHLLEGNPLVRETDTALAERLKKLYLEHDCWTWMDDHEWPQYESFYRIVESSEEVQPSALASFPLNYIPYNLAQGPIRKIASKALPESVKSHIKRTYNVD